MVKVFNHKLINLFHNQHHVSCYNITSLISLLVLIAIIMPINNLAVANNLPDFGNETQLIISSKQEMLIGKIWLHQLRKADIIEPDPIINTYINHLGNSLLAHAHQVDLDKFHFFVLAGREINAFAFFGGNIGVFSGLINITNTESELAAILAHEISHVNQKHFSRQLLKQKKLMPITLAETAIALAVGIPDLIMPILGGHMHQMLTFSRENEQEADRMGIQLLNKSKFDTRAMADIFQSLSQFNPEHNKIPEYLLTHPMFESRISDAYNRAAQASYKQYIDHIDYCLVKARVNVNLSNNKTNLLSKIENKLKNHRYNNYTALRYEQALVLQQLHKYQQAENIFAELSQKNPDNIIIQLTLAELLSINNPEIAKNKLFSLIQITPDYLPLNLAYAQNLIKLNLPSKAKIILEQYSKNHIYDLIEEPKIYELLIACYQKLNEQDESLFTQAKLFVINGNSSIASQRIEQALQVAKKSNLNKIKTFQNELEKFTIEAKEIRL